LRDTARVELLKKLRKERVETPTDGRLDEIVAEALRVAERAWFTTVPARLAAEDRARVLALVDWREPGEGESAGRDRRGGAASPRCSGNTSALTAKYARTSAPA
jgi:hypothetical protein